MQKRRNRERACRSTRRNTKQDGHPKQHGRQRLSLYKILFHFKSLWESIILVLPPPTFKAYRIAVLLQGHGAIYAPPTDPPPPFFALHHTILIRPKSWKGQPTAGTGGGTGPPRCLDNYANNTYTTSRRRYAAGGGAGRRSNLWPVVAQSRLIVRTQNISQPGQHRLGLPMSRP